MVCLRMSLRLRENIIDDQWKHFTLNSDVGTGTGHTGRLYTERVWSFQFIRLGQYLQMRVICKMVDLMDKN